MFVLKLFQKERGYCMPCYNVISERFTNLRKSQKDKHGKDMPVAQLAQELLESQCITNYTIDVIRQEIGKVEKKNKFPQLFLIEGYSKYFNVTSDYLLGLRETKAIDENIAMINKATGLNEKSINTLISLRKTYRFEKDLEILNYIMSDARTFGDFLGCIKDYIKTDYTIPLHPEQDKETKNIKYVKNLDTETVCVGRKNGEYKGEPLYEFKGIPVSQLSTLNLLQIQEILQIWKQKYKGE